MKELIKSLGRYYPNDKPERHIAVLTQYKAQCSAITNDLRNERIPECKVSTVVASQGLKYVYFLYVQIASCWTIQISSNCVRSIR